jgi:hypothetical protein
MAEKNLARKNNFEKQRKRISWQKKKLGQEKKTTWKNRAKKKMN